MEKFVALIMVSLFLLGAAAFSDTDSANSESITETVESTVIDVEASSVDPDMYEYIQKQIESNTYDNLLQVAKCETATSQQLIRVAKACATFERYESSSYNKELQIKIATALTENSKSSEDVIVELANSKFADVNIIGCRWLLNNYTTISKLYTYLDTQINTLHPDNLLEVAKCEEATTQQLIKVAKECAVLNYYSYSTLNKNSAISIANAICQNPNTTDSVMSELANSKYSEIWTIVAKSDKSGENALKIVANNCANFNCYTSYTTNKDYAINLANIICENPNTTDSVMSELANSKYNEIWTIVAKSDKSGENALKIVANNCANFNCYTSYTTNENYAINLANVISENPNTTDSVMSELANSSFKDVVIIGHYWIENT